MIEDISNDNICTSWRKHNADLFKFHLTLPLSTFVAILPLRCHLVAKYTEGIAEQFNIDSSTQRAYKSKVNIIKLLSFKMFTFLKSCGN